MLKRILKKIRSLWEKTSLENHVFFKDRSNNSEFLKIPQIDFTIIDATLRCMCAAFAMDSDKRYLFRLYDKPIGLYRAEYPSGAIDFGDLSELEILDAMLKTLLDQPISNKLTLSNATLEDIIRYVAENRKNRPVMLDEHPEQLRFPSKSNCGFFAE